MASKPELGVVDTLSLEGAVVPASSASTKPVANWERYDLLDLLGKGGMGEVYKARDHRLDRTIAVKFILSADPNMTKRFLRRANWGFETTSA